VHLLVLLLVLLYRMCKVETLPYPEEDTLLLASKAPKKTQNPSYLETTKCCTRRHMTTIHGVPSAVCINVKGPLLDLFLRLHRQQVTPTLSSMHVSVLGPAAPVSLCTVAPQAIFAANLCKKACHMAFLLMPSMHIL
jgi:hypothetical protein